MNSPWGLEAVIAEKFGYTREYILHGTAFSNFQMMLADFPQTVDKKKMDSWIDYDNLDNSQQANDDDLRSLME